MELGNYVEILLQGMTLVPSKLQQKIKAVQTSKRSLVRGRKIAEKSKTRTGKFSKVQGALPPPPVLALFTVPLEFWQQPEQSDPSNPEA